jgi:hypothetical protein
MPLVQLIYISRWKTQLSEARLQEIVSHSVRRNVARQITGVLLYSGGNIMQVLEGERDSVLALFEIVRADKRHYDVQQLVFKQIQKRLYPEWHMGLADLGRSYEIDRSRMVDMVEDLRSRVETGMLTVEARMLVNDFHAQLHRRAA